MPAHPAPPPASPRARASDVGHTALDAALAPGALCPAYQPIVRLDDGARIGFEALARGSRESPLRTPDELFDTARALGRLVETDERCQHEAVRQAAVDGLCGPGALFVNVEPETLQSNTDALEAEARRLGAPEIVVEITERLLARDPTKLLEAARRLRAAGCRIALDDVGVDPLSLTLLPLLRPDVIKLDVSVLRGANTRGMARVIRLVRRHAERTSATVLAEGIETEADLEAARALGATLGQGWLYGRPEPLPDEVDAVGLQAAPHVMAGRHGSPFETAATQRPVAVGRAPLLRALSRSLELEAMQQDSRGLVVAAVPDAEQFGPSARRRYAWMARDTPLVLVLGRDMDHEPEPGVRGAALDVDDPLCGEWVVACLHGQGAGALIARELPDQPDDERRFAYVLTFDRDLVSTVAGELLARASREAVPTWPA